MWLSQGTIDIPLRSVSKFHRFFLKLIKILSYFRKIILNGRSIVLQHTSYCCSGHFPDCVFKGPNDCESMMAFYTPVLSVPFTIFTHFSEEIKIKIAIIMLIPLHFSIFETFPFISYCQTAIGFEKIQRLFLSQSMGKRKRCIFALSFCMN